MIDPGGVLGEIVARKRIDVAERLSGVTLDALRARAEPTERSLKAALSAPGARFIMEVKRVSPSKGVLRAAADPVEIAGAYLGAADAISVLVDGPYFGGSYADLEAVRATFPGPVLAKDFVVDPRQVPEARLHGADAVLVMLSVLEDHEARAVIDEARRLGMDVLVESHSAEELHRAIALGAEIVGINNRDLKSLAVDLAVTERLAPLVPEGRIIVAESGIGSREDVARLAPHADAYLVGSSLMAAPDPGLAARELAFGRAKVCGLTSPEDAIAAARQGASFAGLIMVPGTPRALTIEQAREIAAAIAIPTVGVFRNEALDRVVEAAISLSLHAVQLHGDEDEAYIAALRTRLPEPVEIWAAAAVGVEVAEPRRGADRILFDTASAGGSGGTGRTFDWSRLAGREELARALLAGGLDPTNASAASRLGAYALDVSSGVESAPGKKDPARLHAFFEALRLPVRKEMLSC